MSNLTRCFFLHFLLVLTFTFIVQLNTEEFKDIKSAFKLFIKHQFILKNSIDIQTLHSQNCIPLEFIRFINTSITKGA